MQGTRRGFTLIELLMVMVVISILAALLLPTLERARARARRIQCVSQLKQLGIAFHTFAHDHHNDFPMKVSTNFGGSKEFVDAANRLNGDFYFAYRHFQPLSNHLVLPALLRCPVDARRMAAPNFAQLQNSNVSYFINSESEPGDSQILAGDGNLADMGSRVQLGGERVLAWNAEMHHFAGNVLFGDGHVEQWRNGAWLASPGAPAPAANLYLPVPGPPSSPPSPSPGHPPNGPYDTNKPGGGGTPPGLFAQLDNISARTHNVSPTPAVATNTSVPTNQPQPALGPKPTPLAPAVVLPMPEPPMDSSWPKRLSEHLTRTQRWPFFTIALLVLAGLLTFELLRRHRRRRARHLAWQNPRQRAAHAISTYHAGEQPGK